MVYHNAGRGRNPRPSLQVGKHMTITTEYAEDTECAEECSR